jgi:hypothetical protein
MAALVVFALPAMPALGIGGSLGRVDMQVRLEAKILEVPGRHSIVTRGLGIDLGFGSTTNEVVTFAGTLSQMAKPLEGSISQPFGGEIPITKITQRKVSTNIPVLSDVPLVGSLFRSRQAVEDKANLQIFITPTILGAEKKKPPFVAIDGAVEVEEGSIKGSIGINRSFNHYKGSWRYKFKGLIQSGPNAGRTVKGTIKVSVDGDRVQ